MRVRSGRSLAILAAVAVAPALATAQAAPWQGPAPASSTAPAVRSAPTFEHYGTTPDPGFTHHFQMPSARPLRLGDSMATINGALGWAGVRYGFHRRFDAGVGLPLYLAGVSLDARYALVLEDGVAVSLWGYASLPVLPGGSPGDLLGFTWSGSGAAWVAGPVVSLWGPKLGVHVGVHVAQRTLLGGAWTLVHATVEGYVTDSLRAIGQGVLLAEVVDESGAGVRGATLVGNRHPRAHPYLLGGLRLHSRRFAVDFGLLAVFGADAPLSAAPVSLWPWMSASQTF